MDTLNIIAQYVYLDRRNDEWLITVTDDCTLMRYQWSPDYVLWSDDEDAAIEAIDLFVAHSEDYIVDHTYSIGGQVLC